MVVESWQTFNHFLCAVLIGYFLHNRLHREVNILVRELLQKRTEATCLSQIINLLTKLELVNNVLNIL